MGFTSQGLTDLYQRKQTSPEPEQTGGHALSFLWDLVSPETHRVFNKYMGGQYEGADYKDVASDLLPENPYSIAQPNALGFTQVTGTKGGQRVVNAFHDKTKELLGSLGYEDNLKNPIFQFLTSEKPRATHEMLNTFVNEMGPRMNDVRVQPPIMPEAVPAFQSWINRGRLDPWPDLKVNLQDVINQTKNQVSRPGYEGNLIPKNTYADQRGLKDSGWVRDWFENDNANPWD